MQEQNFQKVYLYITGPSTSFFILELYTLDSSAKCELRIRRYLRKISPTALDSLSSPLMC